MKNPLIVHVFFVFEVFQLAVLLRIPNRLLTGLIVRVSAPSAFGVSEGADILDIKNSGMAFLVPGDVILPDQADALAVLRQGAGLDIGRDVCCGELLLLGRSI